MTKVLFTSLPWLGKVFSAKEGHRWSYTSDKTPIISFEAFPFYLAYAAANVRKFGHEVSVIYDHKYNDTKLYPKYLKEIERIKPDVLVAETSTPSYINDKKVIRDIKQVAPNTKICLTGQHATALPEEVMQENFGVINHVLVGEYEFTSLEVANSKREDGSELPHVLRNLKLHDIDSIPWPARDLFDMNIFNDTFCENYPNAHIIFSRGCYYSCSYCNIHLSNDAVRKQRVRNIHDVIEEMKFCVEKYHPKEFWIEDDIFNGSEEKVREFCRVKIQESVDTPFSALCHAKIQRETLEMMKMAGCTGIKFGVESADHEVLLRLKKGLTMDMVKKTLINCKELGIRTHLTFAIGLPGDTEETIKKTLRFAQSAGTAYQVSIATPFPGTPLYEEAKANGWLNFNSWEDFDGLNKALINYPTLSAEILYKYYLLAQDSTYKKVFTSGDYKKYLKMIYQERGVVGLLKLAKRPDIIKSVWNSITGTKKHLKLSEEAEKAIDLNTFVDKPHQPKQEVKPITIQT